MNKEYNHSIYMNYLSHGWMSSQDSSVRARQKQMQDAYNHKYYQQHKDQWRKYNAKEADRMRAESNRLRRHGNEGAPTGQSSGVGNLRNLRNTNAAARRLGNEGAPTGQASGRRRAKYGNEGAPTGQASGAFGAKQRFGEDIAKAALRVQAQEREREKLYEGTLPGMVRKKGQELQKKYDVLGKIDAVNDSIRTVKQKAKKTIENGAQKIKDFLGITAREKELERFEENAFGRDENGKIKSTRSTHMYE